MLDVIFYSTIHQQPEYVEVSEEFYEWLAKSQFSKIGKSVEIKILIDGEEEELPLVELNPENRHQLRLFFLEAVAEESDAVLTQIEDCLAKEEYQKATYSLRKLQQLRKCIENENYQYFQRV
ncbi:MAG TPA: hypothetical protein DD379_23370 [Cyanobacteria bacterium UBA11162]|nr:hypothetical protein [Cyanobacteria bacterium UBA11162]